MTAVVLGLGTGAAVGALWARGGICFNRGVRIAVFERRSLVLRIFAIAVGVQLLVLPALVALGVTVNPPGLFPVAQLVGGLVFGAGMALAGGCIAGILWKTGAGSVATAIAIAGFAGGELLARGAAAGVLDDLDRAVAPPRDATLEAVLGVPYALVALVLGVVVLGALLARSRAGLIYGLALGALAAWAWIAAGWADYGFGLGFTGTAANVEQAVEGGDLSILSFEAWLAAGVILGALAATRGPLRMPDGPRAARAAIGGVLMGLGANAAHGCNIGLGLTGVPLLSLGGALGVTCMAIGALVTWTLLLRPLPVLRGRERPEAANF